MKSVNIKTGSKKGFTVIEVVLVLAIAGLIFIMVFVALPALQRNQRNAQRREDVSRLAAALESYKVSNRGKLPVTPPQSSSCALAAKTLNPSNPTTTNKACLFIAKYLNEGSSTTNEFKDPSGSEYYVYIRPWASSRASAPTSMGRIYVNLGAKCNGEVSEQTSRNNEYAILLRLEGDGAVCIDNQ